MANEGNDVTDLPPSEELHGPEQVSPRVIAIEDEPEGDSLLLVERAQVVWPQDATRGFAFDRYGFYDPALGPTRLAARRGIGRLRELAGDTRQRLSQLRQTRDRIN